MEAEPIPHHRLETQVLPTPALLKCMSMQRRAAGVRLQGSGDAEALRPAEGQLQVWGHHCYQPGSLYSFAEAVNKFLSCFHQPQLLPDASSVMCFLSPDIYGGPRAIPDRASASPSYPGRQWLAGPCPVVLVGPRTSHYPLPPSHTCSPPGLTHPRK